ncbi:TM2 domain-containing membrane protein YozV [Anoxybacillus tepidamans]|uniref:TM2 domain-containing membrane protein YozV n=1 Tax=Anoxybacteroides tepidamans TaxID=265948 RepID=A0A7W8IQ21_9BACL|nr:hypothetical protein [Anoxybacillus tepidamans]MBB5323649.1 TM2 domain-containing membrane protein YozV [Anoxybacillus tepidamans]
MAGTVIVNILLGIFGFTIVFLLSFSANSITTTLVRSTITFVLFFLSGYVFRWMFAYIRKDPVKITANLSNNMGEEELQQLMKGLTEEEAQKVAAYIRHMLHREGDS